MGYQIQRLDQSHYLMLYEIMKAQKFPHTPPTYLEAVLFFKNAFMYGVMNEGNLIAAFILIPTSKNAACLDAVCHPDYHGRWCTRKVIRYFLTEAFERHRFSFLWTESLHASAIHLTAQLGFQKIQRTSKGVLSILTPETVNIKWKE